jgi:DNA-binding IclR family transcriptional regulator
MLSALAHHPQGLSVEELAAHTLKPPGELTDVLTLLAKRAVIKHANANIQIAVELMRRWLAARALDRPQARADATAA